MPSKHAGWRGVFRREPPLDESVAHRERLEPELLALLAKQTPKQQPSGRWVRIALGGTVAAAGLIGACQLPADYELHLGHHIQIEIPMQDAQALDPRDLAHFIERNYPVHSLQVYVTKSVHQEHGDNRRTEGTDRLHRVATDHAMFVHERAVPSELSPGFVSGVMFVGIDVVEQAGEDLDTEVIWADLVEQYPVLEGSRVHDEVFDTQVHGTWGGRLSFGLLDVVLDGTSVEDAQRRLAAELASRGMDTSTMEIEITETESVHGGHREIEIHILDERHQQR